MNKKSILSRILSHNIVLLVLSFLLSFTIWFAINATSVTDTIVTISGIPVTIELSEEAQSDGLQVFNANDLTASVDVTGNRVTVGSLSASDIQIIANQTGSIISPGTYTLPLSAKKTGIKTNYNIVSSVTPSSVTVYVDRMSEAEFDIENKLTIKLSDSNHYASSSFSQNKVNVSGPESQVSRINSVAVIDTITVDSDTTKTFQEKLRYLDADGKTLELPLVTADVESVETTITVLPVKTVSLTVDKISVPKDSPDISVDPEAVKIAGPQSALDEIGDSLSVGVLDFTKLKNERYKLPYDISLPNGCRVISGETSASISLDLTSYSKATVTRKITSKIDSSKYNVDFNNSDTVTIILYGPASLMDSISASDVTVVADFTGLLDNVTSSSAVSVNVPLTVRFSSEYERCWAFGSYSASANVSMK